MRNVLIQLRCWWLFVRYATKEQFFALLLRTFQDESDNTNYLFVRRAYLITEREFQGHFRQSGEEYMTHNHALAVILIVLGKVRDPVLIAAALLHDILEEFPDRWDVERLEKLFGSDTALLVDECTITRHLSYFASEEERDAYYYARIHRSIESRALKIKIADRIHNHYTIRFCGPERAAKKALQTRKWITREAKAIHFLDDVLEAMVQLTERFVRRSRESLISRITGFFL